VLALGVVNGRNIWRADLEAILDRIEPFREKLGDRLWIAPPCSLLHVPVDAAIEKRLDDELRSWLACAQQKLEEIHTLTVALNQGRDAVKTQLAASALAKQSRRSSKHVNNPRVQAAAERNRPPRLRHSFAERTDRAANHRAHEESRRTDTRRTPMGKPRLRPQNPWLGGSRARSHQHDQRSQEAPRRARMISPERLASSQPLTACA